MSRSKLGSWRQVSVVGAVCAALLLAGVLQRPAVADVTEVTGSAFGYYVDNSLFGGPSVLRGFGQAADAPATAASPSVELLPAGGNESETDADGAAAVYGPATIFGGIWPEDVASAPPSGPITVAAVGTTGPTGSVTASAEIGLHATPVPVRCTDDEPGQTNCTVPGGIGPGPLIADNVRSTCTATEEGTTASVTFVNGIVETKYDEDTQLPIVSQPIPANPEPNSEVSGTIDHVGDSFRIVFNEQIENPDGTLTVNAAHLFLLGPTAVGDAVVASSTCGVEATDETPPSTDDTPPSTDPDDTTTTTGPDDTTTTTGPDDTTTTTGPDDTTTTTGPDDTTTTTGPDDTTTTTVDDTTTTTVDDRDPDDRPRNFFQRLREFLRELFEFLRELFGGGGGRASFFG